MTVATVDTAPAHGALEPEQRFVIHGVPWSTYVVLRDSLDHEGSGLRLTYREGTLELMSPSGDHEDLKTIIARLVEAWAEENDVDLNGRGSQTFRREAKARGLEADECYSVGEFGEVPQIAIEVEITTSVVDKLDVYAGLGIQEIWLWKAGRLAVLGLNGGTYVERTSSGVLPSLDFAHLAGFVEAGRNQTQTVKAFRRALRERS